jgi:hypothetical protein
LVAAIGALVLIVWGVVSAFKAWKASTLEGKLEAAEKATKGMAEAAENAKNRY